MPTHSTRISRAWRASSGQKRGSSYERTARKQQRPLAGGRRGISLTGGKIRLSGIDTQEQSRSYLADQQIVVADYAKERPTQQLLSGGSSEDSLNAWPKNSPRSVGHVRVLARGLLERRL
jgi:hypothetical protein